MLVKSSQDHSNGETKTKNEPADAASFSTLIVGDGRNSSKFYRNIETFSVLVDLIGTKYLFFHAIVIS